MNVCMCSVYVNNYVVTLDSMDVCAAKQNEILSDTDSDEDNDQSSDEEKSIQEKPKASFVIYATFGLHIMFCLGKIE